MVVLSRGIIESYLWDFGDGATSTQPDPTHSWAEAGTYDVTLTVSRGNEQDRFTERVRERYYPGEEIQQLLEASDFTVRMCEDFNFTANPAVGNIKTWWVAQAEV